jgi:lipid-binding SYLF domain-containing protein
VPVSCGSFAQVAKPVPSRTAAHAALNSHNPTRRFTFINKHTKSLLTTSALYFACSFAVIAAEVPGEAVNPQQQTSSGETRNAAETVQEATQVVQKLKSDGGTKDLLQQAKAVFIVPDYGRAALGVGGAAGQGVLVANNDGRWSSPAFYNIGAINIGLQAGAEAGSIAFLVMSDDAMQNFEEENNFSLDADAGLTIVDYSKRAQANLGKGADVVVWSDTKGLLGELAISVADIMWDNEANQAF